MEHQERIYGYSSNRRMEETKYDNRIDNIRLEQYISVYGN